MKFTAGEARGSQTSHDVCAHFISCNYWNVISCTAHGTVFCPKLDFVISSSSSQFDLQDHQ